VKKLTPYILFSLLLLVFLNGCNSNKNSSKDLFQYKGSYIGDNNAIGSIVKQLPHNEEFKQMSLQTKKEPYGIVLEYGEMKATNIDKVIKETVINNATFIFALVKNAEWIKFDIGNQIYTVTREKLQQWYGKGDLGEFTNEKDLKKLTQNYLKDESKVNQFFEK
jgi:hypothetical protein